MVQQEVIVHVQLVEHPAQGVLANGQDAGVKPSLGCVRAGRLDDSVGILVKSPEPVLQPGSKVPQLLVCAGTLFCLGLLWLWLGLRQTRTGPIAEGAEAFACRTSMEFQLALLKNTRASRFSSQSLPLLCTTRQPVGTSERFLQMAGESFSPMICKAELTTSL